MAPALTEAAGQAQKLKLPYSPTSPIAKDESDLSPTSLKDCDPDELTNLVQELCYANKDRLAPYHVSSGLVVNGNPKSGGKTCPSLSGTHRCCTMNGKTTSKCHNVDSSRVVTTGKHTMGLMKTNAGLMMNANSPGTDMVHKVEAEPQQYETTVPCSTPILQQHHLYPPPPSANLLEIIAARERFQANLKRRTERMLRRIYKLQSTQFAQHVSLQLIDFVSYQRKVLKLPVTNTRASLLLHHNKLSSSSSSSSSNNGNCVNRKSDILQSEDVKNLSTAALVNLVRKLESGSNATATSLKPRKQPQNRAGNCVQRYGARIQLGESESCLGSAKLDRDACEEIKWTSGNLLTNLQHLENDIDSDATASSSGGESCDETEVAADDKRSKAISLPIRRRASWRWAMDRAAVISRWTWLQAQVSDLEFRIHQTSEIYRKIRTMKEPILGEKSNVMGAGTSIQMNGYVAGTSSRISVPSPETGTPLPEGSCSRTCPLRPLKRRKLLRTVDLPKFNRKAAKLSSVQCGCSPMSRVCNICCGRFNFLQTVDADKLSFNERVSLLDPCFHPVLSFPQDIPLAVHFEALLKSGDPGKPIGKPRSATAVKKKGRGPLNINEHARKQCRKLKKNAAATLTAKLRKKLTKDKRVPGRRRRRDAGRPRMKKTSHSAVEQHRQRSISESSGLSSKPESPVPSPGFVENSSSQASGNSSWGSADIREHPKKGGMLHEMMRRRRGESAFDINNIVIPYSMAAATRVERLQYKEILTPKWRLVEDVVAEAETLPVTQGALNDQEDVSDETCAHRHDKCEHDEKKRFMGFLHRQHATARRTRSMRSDSRADSSGANTPDPMSPHNIEMHESPITTPPSTPAPLGEEASQLSTRRRTTSLSKRDRMLDDLRIPTPDFTIDEIPVLPWDPRTFPLQDQEFEQMLQETADYEHSLAGPPTDIMDSEWNAISEMPLMVPDPVPSSSLEDTDWNPTVISTEEKSPTRHSIVLKLAKR